MSERISTANRQLICDFCKRPIPQGCRCRLIRDDFLPFLFYFEHLNCPSGPAVVQPNAPQNKPVISNSQPEPALA